MRTRSGSLFRFRFPRPQPLPSAHPGTELLSSIPSAVCIHPRIPTTSVGRLFAGFDFISWVRRFEPAGITHPLPIRYLDQFGLYILRGSHSLAIWQGLGRSDLRDCFISTLYIMQMAHVIDNENADVRRVFTSRLRATICDGGTALPTGAITVILP